MKEDMKEIESITKSSRTKKITLLLCLLSAWSVENVATASCHPPRMGGGFHCCIPCDPCRYFCPRRDFTVAKYQANFWDPISNRIYPGRVTIEPAEFLDLPSK